MIHKFYKFIVYNAISHITLEINRMHIYYNKANMNIDLSLQFFHLANEGLYEWTFTTTNFAYHSNQLSIRYGHVYAVKRIIILNMLSYSN